MTNLEQLSKGSKFYIVDLMGQIIGFVYHEPLPSHHDYHIVLRNNAYPERMFKTEFEKVCLTYEEAKKEAIIWAETLLEIAKK